MYPGKEPLIDFLDRSLPMLDERSVLVMTSKVVALSEGRYIPKENGLSEETIVAEADHYLPKSESAYGILRYARMSDTERQTLRVNAGTLEPSAHFPLR